MDTFGLAALTLDPGQAVSWVTREIEHAAQQDPSIRAAVTMMEERIDASVADDAELATLASVLWLQLRANILEQSARPSWPPLAALSGMPRGLRAIRLGLADGTVVLDAVRESLDSTFTTDVVRRVAQETRELANRDPRRSDHLTLLEHELRSGADEDVTGHAVVAFAVGFVATMAVGVAAFEIYEHHIADHPHH
jgi:hypothetical protein